MIPFFDLGFFGMVWLDGQEQLRIEHGIPQSLEEIRRS